MSKIKLDDAFKNHLLTSYPVDADVLDRLLDDLGEYFSLKPEEFIALRHHQLQREGFRNEEIYRMILSELKSRRYKAPDFSLRQIRRIIYG